MGMGRGSGEKGQWEGRTKGLTGIAKYDVLRVIAPLGRRMLLPVATMVEMSASREIIVFQAHRGSREKRKEKKHSQQTSFSPPALSAKRTPTPTACLAVTNNSSSRKSLHQGTQNHEAGTTAKRRIRKGVDFGARSGVGACQIGGTTSPCLRR